jgi:hypothetical protein
MRVLPRLADDILAVQSAVETIQIASPLGTIHYDRPYTPLQAFSDGYLKLVVYPAHDYEVAVPSPSEARRE